MRTLGIALLTAVLGFAQLIGPPNPLPSSLATYLDLTATQNARLQQNRVELQRFYNEKSRREAVVRGEIALETNKPVVDPMALGVRYLELEAICRELGCQPGDLLGYDGEEQEAEDMDVSGEVGR